MIASPAGAYFPGGVKPVSVWWSTEYVRAAPGGTGAAKFGGNYAASLAAQAQAAEKGCDQVVWLDAVERRWVEEMGGMNLFFVFGSGPDAEIVTPELSGSLLPGVTRDSLLTLSRELGHPRRERRISTDEWAKKADSGELTEVFACGTAAVITPVGSVLHADGAFEINGGAGRPGHHEAARRADRAAVRAPGPTPTAGCGGSPTRPEPAALERRSRSQRCGPMIIVRDRARRRWLSGPALVIMSLRRRKRRAPLGPAVVTCASRGVTHGSAADDLAGLQARGADVQLPHGAGGDLRPHRLDVRVPPTVRPAMRVGYVHAETGTLATHVTHGSHAEHHLSK